MAKAPRPSPLADLAAVRGIIDAVPHPIFIKDAETHFVAVNQMMCDFMGHRFDEMVGRTDYDFVPAEQADVFRRNDLRVLTTGEISENEELFSDEQGALRTIVTRKKRLELPNGAKLLVGCITDISDFRRAEELIRYHAEHDSLTGLANRRQFLRLVDEALADADAAGNECTILLIDLDRFKPVNDAYGHTVGDAVLCEVASRFKSAIDKGGVVARLGGDEFAVISCARRASLASFTRQLAARLIATARKPIRVGNLSVEVGASIGVARYPGDGPSAEALLRAADMAMYSGKRQGRGTYRFFEKRMDTEMRAQMAIEADLRRAVAEDRIEPWFQPLISLNDRRLIGFEILARWPHPERGFVPPDIFIPLAEKNGLISALTFNILTRAARLAAGWPPSLTIALNLSPTQLGDSLLPMEILRIITEARLPPSRLQIEITENALVADVQAAKAVLTTFRRFGMKVVLDDFGTGYSSLKHLRELPFDHLKIDRSFVQSMGTNPEADKIVHAILGLARTLGLPTTAEGIETADVLDELVRSGCDVGQGYYFGEALPGGDVLKLLQQPAPRRSLRSDEGAAATDALATAQRRRRRRAS